MESKRFLVTAGAGFIGSHFCDELVEQRGREVLAVDYYFTRRRRNIQHLLENIKALIGSSSEIVFESVPQDDPKHRRPFLTLAQDLLSWEPDTPLEEGLNNTICYFDKLMSATRLNRTFALQDSIAAPLDMVSRDTI